MKLDHALNITDEIKREEDSKDADSNLTDRDQYTKEMFINESETDLVEKGTTLPYNIAASQ